MRALEAGKLFCINCGHIISEGYYVNSTDNTYIVKLVRNVLRNGHNSYVAEKYEIVKDDVSDKFVLAGKIENLPVLSIEGQELIPGLPVKIKVQDKGTTSNPNRTMILERCCPHCRHINTNPLAGTTPTYILLAVGKKNAGKTEWINSLSLQGQLNKLNRTGHSRVLDVARTIHHTQLQAATPEDSVGATNYFYIKSRDAEKGFPIEATVIIVDASGEAYNQLKEGKGRAFDLLKGAQDSGPIAGVFFFDNNKDDQNDNNEIYNQLVKLVNLDTIPVANVRTHLDLLIKNPNSIPKIAYAGGDISELPALTPGTFTTRGNQYTARAMIQRWRVQNVAGTRITPSALGAFTNPNHCCFLVQSMDPNASDNRKYDANINLLDPLLWMLCKLDLYPLTKIS